MIFLWFSYGIRAYLIQTPSAPDGPRPVFRGDEVGLVEPPQAEASTASRDHGRVAGILSHGGAVMFFTHVP